MLSPHTLMQRTPVRRPNGKARKRSISGLACVRVGVRGGDSVKCGVRVQVEPKLRVRVKDGTGCGLLARRVPAVRAGVQKRAGLGLGLVWGINRARARVGAMSGLVQGSGLLLEERSG